MVAGDLMESNVVTLAPTDTIADAAEVLTRFEHSMIPVVDDERRLVGMVTEMDVLALALPSSIGALGSLRYLPRCYGLRDLTSKELRGTTVDDVMRTDDLVTVAEDEPAAEAALVMMRSHLPQLPVVRDGKLVGRICRKALIMELINPSLGVTCHP